MGGYSWPSRGKRLLSYPPVGSGVGAHLLAGGGRSWLLSGVVGVGMAHHQGGLGGGEQLFMGEMGTARHGGDGCS